MKKNLLFASIVVGLICALALNKDLRRIAHTRMALWRGDWYLNRHAPREALAAYAEAIEFAFQRRKPDLVSYEKAKTRFRRAVDQLRADPAMKDAFVGGELNARGEPRWTDPGCGTMAEDLGLSPRQLVEEYLRRDYQGAFLKSTSWLGAALSCPNFGGGPDTIDIVTGYKIRTADENHFTVEFESVGTVSGHIAPHFEPQGKRMQDMFVVGRTPWGWKLDKGVFALRCSPSAVLRDLNESGKAVDPSSIDTLQRLSADEMKL